MPQKHRVSRRVHISHQVGMPSVGGGGRGSPSSPKKIGLIPCKKVANRSAGCLPDSRKACDDKEVLFILLSFSESDQKVVRENLIILTSLQNLRKCAGMFAYKYQFLGKQVY